MKKAILFLAIVTAANAQTGFSSTVTLRDTKVTVQSNIEPSTPPMAATFRTGTRAVVKGNSDGMQRYLADLSDNQYFGYDLLVERIPATGNYLVTFSSLSATPTELGLPPSRDWKLIPAPGFPAPQVVLPRYTMVLDLFQNPRTGQKLVDCVRLEATTPQCSGQDPGKQDIACLSSLLEDANRVLAKAVDSSAKQQSSRETSIRQSQLTWSRYKADVCNPMQDEAQRLQCELILTNSRIDELKKIY